MVSRTPPVSSARRVATPPARIAPRSRPFVSIRICLPSVRRYAPLPPPPPLPGSRSAAPLSRPQPLHRPAPAITTHACHSSIIGRWSHFGQPVCLSCSPTRSPRWLQSPPHPAHPSTPGHRVCRTPLSPRRSGDCKRAPKHATGNRIPVRVPFAGDSIRGRPSASRASLSAPFILAILIFASPGPE